MKIDIYSFSWNESLILPYFLRYYENIVDNIIFYDNGSTDGTIELLKNHPKVKMVPWEIVNESAFKTSGKIRNNMWKESIGEADWVIVCDTDEFVYHKNLRDFLEIQRKMGKTLVQTIGYEMVSDSFPTTSQQIYKEVRTGVRVPKYDKTIVFNPNKITEINYEMGSHKLNPVGEIKYCEDKLFLLHYKFLGLDYLLKRYKQLRSGIQRRDPHGWGIHWKRTDDEITHIFNKRKGQAIDVISLLGENK